MATISVEKRQLINGVTYRARVRITKKGKVIDKNEKTFKNRETAKIWAKKAAKILEEKQQEIASGTYHAEKDPKELRDISVGELIVEYLEHPITSQKVGRTKGFVLQALLNYDIAHIYAHKITDDNLIEHCMTRLAGETKGGRKIIPTPQTVYHDISYLHTVMKIGRSTLFKVNVNLDYHDETIPVLVELGLIGRSIKRKRRPKKEELRLLEEALKERENHRSAIIPYSDILQFSICSAMRIGEITKLKWSDIDHEHKTIEVLDRKDPREQKGNDWEVPLLGEAYAIIMRQEKRKNPEKAIYIFPFNPRSISAGWQRVR